MGSLVLLNPYDSIIMVFPDTERELWGLVPTLLSLSFFGFVFLWECLFCIIVYQKFVTFKLHFIGTHK